MSSKRRTTVLRAMTLCLVLATCSLSWSCRYDRWVQFNPAEFEEPITMFDVYVMDIRGYIKYGQRILIDVSYIADVTDRYSIDTLPLLILDSVCMRGDCLDEEYCRVPLDWRSLNKLRMLEDPYFHGFKYGAELHREDLYVIDGKIVPSGWILEYDHNLHFPGACGDSAVSVEIWARLLDYRTGQVRSAESKLIEFLIKPRKRWECGS